MAAASVILLFFAVFAYRAAGQTQAHALVLKDPLELTLMLRFLALLAGIMLLAKWLSSLPGPSGLLTLGGVSGILDVDPITLSMARLARTGLTPSLAVETIFAAAVANGFAKAVLAFYFGGARLGMFLGLAMVAALGAGALIYLR
jgi:uncharacterized membrane protein (DUF4010 family)